MASEKMLTLRSSDGIVVEVEQEVAMISTLFKNMIEDGCTEGITPLAPVDGKTLTMILKYCRKYVEHQSALKTNEAIGVHMDSEELHNWHDWQENFVDVKFDILIDRITAASFPDIQCLLDLAYKTVARMMASKTVEEIRQLFNIQNDYTPEEEEEELRKENAWAFGGSNSEK